MGIVWANCKLVLLLIRAHLAIVVLVGLLTLALLAFAAEKIVVSAAFFGLCLSVAHPFSAIHRDLVPKPSFFCLPGYRNALRVMILVDAVVGGLVYAVVFAVTFQRDEWGGPFAGCCALIGFLGGLTSALLGPGKHFPGTVAGRGLQAFPLFLGVIGVVIGMVATILGSWLIWPVGALICAAACVFLWARLSDEHDLARAHRMTVEDAMARRAKAGSARMAPGWIHDLFLALIRRHHPLGTWRYIWTSFYRTFGPLLFTWRRVLVGAFVLSLLLLRPVAEVTFVLMGFVAILVDLPVTSSMLLPGGRRERFFATVVVALGLSLLLVAVATATVCFSGMIVMLLGSHAWSVGTPLHSVWLACILVPWMCAWRWRGCGRSRTRNEISSFLYKIGLLIFLALLLVVSNWSTPRCYLFCGAVMSLGWLFFLEALQRACVRGDLLGPKPLKGGRP